MTIYSVMTWFLMFMTSINNDDTIFRRHVLQVVTSHLLVTCNDKISNASNSVMGSDG
jgi:hypothetical protein